MEKFPNSMVEDCKRIIQGTNFTVGEAAVYEYYMRFLSGN